MAQRDEKKLSILSQKSGLNSFNISDYTLMTIGGTELPQSAEIRVVTRLKKSLVVDIL
jgi:hypothetical protein